MNYDPPYINSNIFNASYFTDLDGSLTLAAADLRYLKLSGGVVYGLTTFSNSLNVIGTLSINGSAIDLSLISGVTAGTPQASKALSLNALSQIDGNLQFAVNRKILMNNSASSGAYIDMGATASDRCISLFSDASSYYGFGANSSNLRSFSKDSFAWYTGATQSTIGTSIMTLNSAGLLTTASLTATSITGTLQTAAQPNITSLGTLTSITTSGTLTMGSTIISAAEIAVLDGVTPGTAIASKACISDSNNYLQGLTRLSVGGTNGSQTINALTGAGNNASIRVGNAESANKCWTMQYLDATNILRWDAFGSNSQMTLSTSGDLTAKLSFDTPAYKLSGVAITMSALTGITLGTAAASKALTLDASSNITGIVGLSATSITGTIQTAAQPNITSLGTLTTLNVTGLSSTSNTRMTTSTNYNGIMDTASIVLKQSSTTNGNKIGLDFMISTNAIDSVNTATCSIYHERIAAYQGDLVFSTKRIFIADSALTEALRISSTGTCSIANTSSGFQLNLGGSGTGINTNALTTTSLTFGATAITATGIELNYLDLTTGAGTAEASKALVLDSSKNIATLNLLTSNYLTANLAINSPNAIASFGAVNIGPIVTAYGISSIKGTVGYSSTFFGSTNSILWMEGSNASVIKAEINISSGPGSTSTNGMRIGTCTANQFSLFTNATNRLIITSTGNVGIGSNASTNDKVFGILDGTAGSTQVDFRYGNALSSNNCFTMSYIPTSSGSGLNRIQFDPYGTSGALTILAKKYVGIGGTSPVCPLDVAGFDSGLGILAPYQYAGATSGDGGYVASGTTTGVNINARFQDNVIFDQKIYIRSDRRVKKDIVPLTIDLGIKFVEEVDPVLFRKKDQSSDAMMEIGYIAQDIMKAGFGNIITHTDNDKLKVEEEGDIENIQFNVDYSRVCAILHSVVKDQQKKINELESNFESILDELKEIKSNRKLQY